VYVGTCETDLIERNDSHVEVTDAGMPQFEAQCRVRLFCGLLVSCRGFVVSYTFVRLGYRFFTLSEKEVVCNVVTHVVMNYFTIFRTDNISYLTFIYPVREKGKVIPLQARCDPEGG